VIGTARVTVENAGSASWRSDGAGGLQLSYHWLDPIGNPIVWDGIRTPLPTVVGPGSSLTVDVTVQAPRPPGRYRLAFDLVEEHRFWLQELGCSPLELEVDVAPRIAERRLSVVIHGAETPETSKALAEQEEPPVTDGAVATAHLVAGAMPARGWSSRVLDAHAEGYAAVGVSVVEVHPWFDRRRLLVDWSSESRNPRFPKPLLLPSLEAGLTPTKHLGLPAYSGPDGLYDGRARITLPRRSGRRPG
jgi:hypothetical protein